MFEEKDKVKDIIARGRPQMGRREAFVVLVRL